MVSMLAEVYVDGQRAEKKMLAYPAYLKYAYFPICVDVPRAARCFGVCTFLPHTVGAMSPTLMRGTIWQLTACGDQARKIDACEGRLMPSFGCPIFRLNNPLMTWISTA